MTRPRVVPTIFVGVQPCDDGTVALRLHHPKNCETVLYLEQHELQELSCLLNEASKLAGQRPPKPRLAFSLIRDNT